MAQFLRSDRQTFLTDEWRQEFCGNQLAIDLVFSPCSHFLFVSRKKNQAICELELPAKHQNLEYQTHSHSVEIEIERYDMLLEGRQDSNQGWWAARHVIMNTLNWKLTIGRSEQWNKNKQKRGTYQVSIVLKLHEYRSSAMTF